MTVPSGGEPASPREEPAQPREAEPRNAQVERTASPRRDDATPSAASTGSSVQSNTPSAQEETSSPEQPSTPPDRDEASAGETRRPDSAVPAPATGGQTAEPARDDHGMPIPMPPVSRPPAGSAFGYDESQNSEQFRLAVPPLDTIVAGPAVGSMISGIGALLVALAASCLGTVAGMVVTVATIVLAVFCAAAAGLLAGVSLRQIKRGAGEYSGRGMAVAGLCCGGAAILVVFFAFLVIFAVAA